MQWHIYAGLFTTIYLLAFGISSLILNHGWDVENKEVSRSWEKQIKINADLPDPELGNQIRDELGLMGWVVNWETYRDSTSLHTEVTHLSKTYSIKADLASGFVHVDEIDKGFLATFHGLHFFGGKIPNAPAFLQTWWYFRWITLAVMLVSLALGLVLWIKYSFRRWHLGVFGFLFIGSLILMITL